MANKALFAESKENLVLAKGRVIGIGRDDYGHKRFVLYVRGSKDKNPAYISFAIQTDMPLNVAINDTIDVEGHYVCFVAKPDSFRKMKHRPMQYFVADKVTKSVTEMEKMFGIEGFAHEPAFCRAYFKGEVKNVDPSSNNWVNATIKIPGEPGNHYENTALLQYTTRMRVNDANVQAGDKVCAICFVTSKKKIRNDKELFFEDFIVEDWVITEEAPGKKRQKVTKKKNEPIPFEQSKEKREEEEDALVVGA